MCFLLKTLLWTFLACTTDLRTKTWSKSLPTDHNNKKGSCLGKLCSWEDTMVGIILASTSNVSRGKNYLAQWCLKYFVELNKTRISKQAEGTLASLPGEWKECWEWTAVDLGEKIRNVSMWGPSFEPPWNICQKFTRLTRKTLWKQSFAAKTAGDIVE